MVWTPPMWRDFIDLSGSYVKIKVQVFCTAGNIVTADNLAPTNLFAHGMFEKVTLTDESRHRTECLLFSGHILTF